MKTKLPENLTITSDSEWNSETRHEDKFIIIDGAVEHADQIEVLARKIQEIISYLESK